ncbi:apicomplexan specific Pf 23612804 and Py 23478322 [Cryptosporidium parvum Iowa II]|uniref:Apicomplexan specific Pf 23612804 and Py 23478322 n=2 Tax=Cryptosporidium parvum TaxID=5807 RepID=Q5CVB7_CRYPI|nr:apicomplexan specific Pf 23612804 and Py 23478322 [Cryptosporidium parvum Iowa II]EAK89602.1 apicomplexan specific Pf 23612804 and Py 23478322 [Cryptosporidium parvum Iowa II]QOY40232.1 Uncharacterized Protein CPATCC_0004890 [Cryptosporidium parvum]WKS79730.1 hypothetical protein CPCDC_8g4670 [Cryptosporidium sp. 43IA8]WRK34230.1 Uncharacterized Protein cpbgf_8004670 [Cryptosporidium parvum]|eukprot:QOY40232.1 hypothetical protein CPATCC_004336 [Cryptosporidium parvum]
MKEVSDDIYSRVRKIKFKRLGLDPSKKSNQSEKVDYNNNKKDKDDEHQYLVSFNSKVEEKKKKGEGRIITSNTTVQGFHTKFQQELKIGDYIEIEHPNTLIKESRQVVSIVSERTLIVDSEFSCDLVSTSEYYYYTNTNDNDLDILNKSNTYSYREKDGMFKYKTVVKSVNSKLSREDILDIRAKKQRDKYCWI